MANRSFIEYSLDLLSIPEYVIEKGRKTSWPQIWDPRKEKEYHLVHNVKRRCIKKYFKGILDRFLRDHVFCKRMLEHDRDEDVFCEWDDLAEQDFTNRMSKPDYFHYRKLDLSQKVWRHWRTIDKPF